MIKIDKKKLLISVFIFLVLTSFVYALQSETGNIILGIWYDNNPLATSTTITDGDPISFNVYGLAIGSELTILVELIKGSGEIILIAQVNRPYMDFNEFGLGTDGDYTIDQSAYSGPGSHKIRLTVTGDASSTGVLELDLIVLPISTPPINNPPQINSTPVTNVNESSSYNYQVTATDADGDTLTYSLTQNPTWISINSSTGLINGTAPAVASDVNYSVIVEVSDGTDTGNQSFNILVEDIPPTDTTPPVVTIIFPQSTTYSFQVTQLQYTASDLNLNTCWYSINNGITNSTPITCGSVFSINSVEGTNTWTVYASDSFGNIGSDNVVFTVEIDDDDDDDGGGDNKVSYTYQDPNEEEFLAQIISRLNPIIDLTDLEDDDEGLGMGAVLLILFSALVMGIILLIVYKFSGR